MYPLQLNVNPEGWRIFMLRKRDKRFMEIRKSIFLRDEYRCQFCGATSKKYHEIVNLDHNYLHNKINNLVTACVFCAQCFFIETVGTGAHSGGALIYLPEMTQNNLNGLCHVLFREMLNDSEYKEIAQNIYRDLKLRSQIIEDEWGDSMHEPSVLGQVLIEFRKGSVFTNNKLFQSVRLLPSRAAFKMDDENGLDTSSLIV